MRPAAASNTRTDHADHTDRVCKLLIRHDDPAARAKFMDADGLHRVAFREHSGFSHYDQASRETLVFMARKGQPLPKLTLPTSSPI
jgi:hypothetical protein